jgi:DUF4097 and DUF4098 domain-containing protein YvlB
MPKFNRSVATACLLAAFTASASAKIERVVERTFQVQPGVHINVTTSGGEIAVESSNDSVVRIVAKEHIRAGSDAEADDILKKLDLKLEQSGNEVTASATYATSMGFHFGGSPVQVDFVMTVPVSASADLKSSGGDILVKDLAGSVHAHTSGGDIKLGNIGGAVDASTSGGNVVLGEGRSTVRLSTSGGNVSAKHLGGPADLRTSGGDIKVDTADSSLRAETSGGDVKAAFAGDLGGECYLSTSGGQVQASVRKDIGFHLDASTSGGEVDASGLTITIDHGGLGRSSLAGLVNGGGPLLKLRSSGGDIEISTR